MAARLSRRRFITISAAALAAGLGPASVRAAAPAPVRWRGIAMGARAELILDHPDRRQAEKVLIRVRGEIRRLEKVFSLFDGGSDLSRLNRSGSLDLPHIDLLRCLDDAARISRLTDGAFDATVQPLWDLYAGHFAARPATTEGPARADIEAVIKRVDYRAVRYGPQRISFARPGMALTLNGIAQGYVTDRVVELLQAAGFTDLLVDLGETRGLGRRRDGSNWRVGIEAPDGSGKLIRKQALRNKAIATSGGYGTRFTADGAYHHLFDPKTGRSNNLWTSISVIADDATRADALSTAFSGLPESRIRSIADDQRVSVIAGNGPQTVLINL